MSPTKPRPHRERHQPWWLKILVIAMLSAVIVIAYDSVKALLGVTHG
jgi:hypothetical protein